MLLQAGAVACLPYLEQLVAAGSSSRATAVAVAGRMIDVWDTRSSDGVIDDDGQRFASQRVRMLDALGLLGDSAMLERFIASVLTLSHDGSENGALLASLHVLSDERAAALLSDLVAARMPKSPNGCAKLLLALSEKPVRRYSSVAEAALTSLDRIRPKVAELPALQWPSFFDKTQPPTAEFVEDLLTALQRFGSAALAVSAAQRIAERPAVFDPVTVVIPALARIDAGRRRKKVAVDSGLANLWTHAATFLLERSATTPQPPTDWRQDVRIGCSCADCKELQAFARDPGARVHRFRVRKDRRQHLHRAIDKHRLDMTHVTERVGSPQTLVCAKDHRGFERRMAEYRSDVAAMRALVRIAPLLESAEKLSSRMQKAIASAE